MDADEQSVHSVVAGIGINVHQKVFPEEIAQTAGSLDLLSGSTANRAALIRAFLTEFEAVRVLSRSGAFMEAYRARSATLGHRVKVIGIREQFVGTALRVTESGTLVVEDDEGMAHEVLAADVSVRGLMGYV